MWENLNKAWQESFSLAIDSYKKGSIPIGAVIVNEQGEIIAKGRNLIYENTTEQGQISGNNLSHAEINAILKINKKEHPNIRSYILYTTMEPCPLCFGAIIMANIRSVKFSARDGWAGATNLKNDYINSKQLKIEGPISILEEIQIALHTVYELKNYGRNKIIETFAKDSLKGVKLGEYLYQNNILENLINKNEENKTIFNSIYEILQTI